jgi:hypothetical protein
MKERGGERRGEKGEG